MKYNAFGNYLITARH